MSDEGPSEELSPAEREVRRLLLLGLPAPRADDSLAESIVDAARWQSQARAALLTIGVLGAAWADTLMIFLNARPVERRG